MFNAGYKHFESGDWANARKLLRQVESIKRAHDEPAQVLLNFMAKSDF